jgi:hypothetical protein
VTSFAHIGGIPVEETAASLAPVALLAFGAASATVRARLRRLRARRHAGAVPTRPL